MLTRTKMNKNCPDFQTPPFGRSKECIITSYNTGYAVRSLSRDLTHIAPYGRNIAYTETLGEIWIFLFLLQIVQFYIYE